MAGQPATPTPAAPAQPSRLAPPAPTRSEDLEVANRALAQDVAATTAPVEAAAAPATPASPPRTDLTVAEMRERLATVTSVAALDRELELENARDGGARKTAVEAIEARRAELAAA